MMNKNRGSVFFLFGLIVICTFFCSCDPAADLVWSVVNNPVQVETIEENGVRLATEEGFIWVSGMGTEFVSGQYLLASYVVTSSDQSESVVNFQYHEADFISVQLRNGSMEDEYLDSISAVTLNTRYLDKTLFFALEQQVFEGQFNEYELICNEDSIKTNEDGESIPSLYFRSKVRNLILGPEDTPVVPLKQYLAVDMSVFADKYADAEGNMKFNLFFRSGTKEASDLYRAGNNPIEIKSKK